MKYRCIIIDDEPLAAQVIESYLQKLEQFEIVAVNENALDAFHIIQTKPVDLIFLDIEMPEVTGIEFIKSIKKSAQNYLNNSIQRLCLRRI